MFKYFGYTKFGTESEHGFVGESSGIQFLGVNYHYFIKNYHLFIIQVAKSVEEGAVLVASYCHHSKIDKTAIKTVLTNVGTSGHFNFPTEEYIWNFLSDNGLIYILICRTNYPQRCAALCLDECKSTFESKYALTQTISAKENSLSKGFKDQFRKLCVKYNNPADVDAIASAKRKVDSVKLVMQDNIELALRNCVKLETMEQATGR